MTIEGKRQSIPLTEGPSRAAARSYLRGAGFSKDDLHKPIIGIANTWTEIGTCNVHLREIAEALKEGIREAGGTPMEFNTVTISDGITMGTQGMKASLVSREVIADSIELVARGNLFDGLVGIGGCDKNMPGIIMALCRLDIPGMMLYGGSIAPGKLNGVDITIQNVFEGIGSHAAGSIDDAGLEALEANACPGAGACGGQFTANTMAMSGEILGISPIQLSGVPATSKDKHAATREAGRILMDAVRANRRPSQIITRKSIENTIASVAASGGSTNAVLHLLAIAREMGIRALHRRLRRHLQAHSVYLRSDSCRQISSPPTTRPPAARACSPSASSMRVTPTARRSPSAARRSPKKPRSPRRLPARSSSTHSRSPSSPPAASSFSKAISPPKAA